MLQEFKDFAMRGNVVDMAVGVIIGAAFGKITTSLVNDVVMPPIGMLLGGVDFSDRAITLKDAAGEAPAVMLKYGVFINTVLDFMIENGAERDDLILAFGGGVVGDLTGLAAGLLKRGARFVQIPTTLLAQVDSSVGGKTAINSRAGKNLIGLFHQPVLVLADLGVLDTLPERERAAGLAEPDPNDRYPRTPEAPADPHLGLPDERL